MNDDDENGVKYESSAVPSTLLGLVEYLVDLGVIRKEELLKRTGEYRKKLFQQHPYEVERLFRDQVGDTMPGGRER